MPRGTKPKEARREESRAEILKAIDTLYPGILGNPFLPHWPHPPQMRLLGAHLHFPPTEVFQALYGGAAGGGKSDALLMAAAQYAWRNPEFAAICFRKRFTDLIEPGALLDRAKDWWIPLGVSWEAKNGRFVFPSGAKVSFAHLSAPEDHLKYQGAEYQLTAWDELTQWATSKQFEYVGLSRVRRRSGSNVPLRTLTASNPGGPGHSWVQEKFIGSTDLLTGERSPAPHLYIPARIQDNPSLDQDAYIKGLMHLHPTTRAQLLAGDWSARETGDYFRAEWFGPLLDPAVDTWPSRDCRRIRWWDLAASTDKDAARTAGVLMARHVRGCRAIEHAVAFRKTPGSRDDTIVRQAQLDGHNVTVGIEIEGGSGGLAQYLALEKRLHKAGIRVVGATPNRSNADLEAGRVVRSSESDRAKEGRADPVASCLERGYQRRGECPDTGGPWWGSDYGKTPDHQEDGIRLFAGPWTRDYLDEVEGFPEAHLKDLVDATSGAWAWLESHPVGLQKPPRDRNEKKAATSHDLHPEERQESEPQRWLRP